VNDRKSIELASLLQSKLVEWIMEEKMLKLWFNDYDYVVAENASDASVVCEEHYGGDGDFPEDEWVCLSDDYTLTLTNDDGSRESKSCYQWVQEHGKGLLASTEL